MSPPALPPGAFSCSLPYMNEPSLGTILSSPPPAYDAAVSLALLATHWGLEGDLLRLSSERDLNWRVTTPAGRYVLKFANRAEDPQVTRFQNLALIHIAARDPGLPVPRVVPSLAGETEVTLPDGSLMRLLSYVEGVPMHLAPASPGLRQGVGRMAARLTRALQGFAHPAADHVLQWDLKQADGLRPLLPAITDPGLRDLCARWLDWFAVIQPDLAALPWQVIHADLNPHNMLTAPDDPARVTGVLDFGDMVHTPRICDLAVAAAYHIDPDAGPQSLAQVAAGWAEVLPILPSEAQLLPGLAAIRMVTTLTLANHRAARWPENAPYILRNCPSALAGLRALPPPGQSLS